MKKSVRIKLCNTKTSLLTVFFVCLFVNAYSQIGIIQDKDGYTNVREKGDINSKIIYQLKDNEVFFYYPDDFGNSDWVGVLIPKNKFSINKKHNQNYFGYVHSSRIKPIEELERLKKPSVQLVFSTELIETDSAIINDIYNEKRTYTNYFNDSIIPLGGELLYSFTSITNLNLIWNGEVIPQSKTLVQDMNNLPYSNGEIKSDSFKNRFITYKKDNVYFIQQGCGDGEYIYMVVWVIKNKEIIQRLAGWIY